MKTPSHQPIPDSHRQKLILDRQSPDFLEQVLVRGDHRIRAFLRAQSPSLSPIARACGVGRKYPHPTVRVKVLLSKNQSGVPPEQRRERRLHVVSTSSVGRDDHDLVGHRCQRQLVNRRQLVDGADDVWHVLVGLSRRPDQDDGNQQLWPSRGKG